MTHTLPRHLICEVTRRCNYACPFCYCVWHEKQQLASRGLSTAEWGRILRHVLARGVKELLFTGGEALMRPDLAELVALARSTAPECSLSLFTNGSRMTEELLVFLRENRVRISSSLPGLASYGEMTGTRRSASGVLALIARAKELDWPLDVSLTATARNRGEFADMFCAAALSGAASIQAGAMMLSGRGRRCPELMLSRGEWDALKDEIRALPSCGIRYSFCDELLCSCREQPPELLAAFAPHSPAACNAGREFGVIGPSGYYRRCLHTVENLCRWQELEEVVEPHGDQ